MPAVRLSRIQELGRRACLWGLLLPCLGVAQGVSAGQVLAIGVHELHSFRFDPLVSLVPSDPESRSTQGSSGLRWTTNGESKKLTVEAFPVVSGLKLMMVAESFGEPITADLGTGEKHRLRLPVGRSAGSGSLRYDAPHHAHSLIGECLIRFTITNF